MTVYTKEISFVISYLILKYLCSDSFYKQKKSLIKDTYAITFKELNWITSLIEACALELLRILDDGVILAITMFIFHKLHKKRFIS